MKIYTIRFHQNQKMLDSYKHKGMRKQLVDELRTKGITDQRVLDAINKIPRHFFLDSSFLEHAYQDKAFRIEAGQTISQPFTVAFQSQLLEIKKGDKVLEIGTGSGYQTCVLLELGAEVYTIETQKVLHQKSSSFLRQMGYKAQFFLGDGTIGLKQFSPFDKIIVTAGAPQVPEAYMEQMKIGGVLVIPVGDDKKQIMVRIKKIQENEFSKENFGDFKFVKLLGQDGW